MSDETLLHFCSPTLAGLKCGNLFSDHFASYEEMLEEIREYNHMLSAKGMILIALTYQDHRGLMYLYRPAKLRQSLSGADAQKILKSCGYTSADPVPCLLQLRDKISDRNEFPHEIGLFLNYPPEDVRGFIDEKASNYKLIGTWKVYGDVDRAQKTFDRYQHCTEVYKRCYRGGVPIQKLMVSE